MYIKAKKDATSEIKKIADGLEGFTSSLRKIDIIKAWRILINKGC
jgi:hypothetical protein